MSVPQPITVQAHLFEQQSRLQTDASGDFSWLLSGITLATKMVAAQIRRAGLTTLLGGAGEENVHGESQQKLDVFANNALLHCLRNRGNVGVLASEENEEPVVVMKNPAAGRYIVIFDPLDGSSNIDLNTSVGTIFSILRRDTANPHDPVADVLQSGLKQIAAGYVLYGSSVLLVYTTGHGVHGFTLDPSIGAYILSHPDIRMPARGNLYSVNEAYMGSFPEHYKSYLDSLKSNTEGVGYSSRYIGSLVADFHRTLLRGGIFLYPPTAAYPEGKLRLMYEANPIAFLAEQAGGAATDGTQRIMEIKPRDLHQRTALVVGSQHEMNRFAEYARAAEMVS